MTNFRTDSKNFSAETNVGIGVKLRSQIVDGSGAPTGTVVTGGALRAYAVNLGLMSFQVQMHTQVIGNGVTDTKYSSEWTVTLLLPGSSGARKGESQDDTELMVSDPKQQVAFRTVSRLESLANSSRQRGGTGHYESPALDVFGTTVS